MEGSWLCQREERGRPKKAAATKEELTGPVRPVLRYHPGRNADGTKDKSDGTRSEERFIERTALDAAEYLTCVLTTLRRGRARRSHCCC